MIYDAQSSDLMAPQFPVFETILMVGFYPIAFRGRMQKTPSDLRSKLNLNMMATLETISTPKAKLVNCSELQVAALRRPLEGKYASEHKGHEARGGQGAGSLPRTLGHELLSRHQS